MPDFTPLDPRFEDKVRESFGRQTLMTSINASIIAVAPGTVTIEMSYRADLTQQNGYIHAGIITAIVDSACGYSAYSLMPADRDVLTVEYKINLLAPAAGDRFTAVGQVKRAGRTLTVCEGDVYAHQSNISPKLIASMLATLIAVESQPFNS